ncbi:MAG: hypothetical protein H6R11_266, partial [Proteobacteria bacterium]|nr:hypothetical protein [Pseudomonadota bacterium]
MHLDPRIGLGHRCHPQVEQTGGRGPEQGDAPAQ